MNITETDLNKSQKRKRGRPCKSVVIRKSLRQDSQKTIQIDVPANNSDTNSNDDDWSYDEDDDNYLNTLFKKAKLTKERNPGNIHNKNLLNKVMPEVGIAEETIKKKLQSPTDFYCGICNITSTTAASFLKHNIRHTKKRTLKCEQCETTFHNIKTMECHVQNDHLNGEIKRYECKICGKIVINIKNHMGIHKTAKFKCEFCEKCFTKNSYYKEHVRIHNGIQPHECKICHSKFNKKSNLNVHLIKHEKLKDEFGVYLKIKPRGRRASYLKLVNQENIKMDVMCGSNTSILNLEEDLNTKVTNVLSNSKMCDTLDLGCYSSKENVLDSERNMRSCNTIVESSTEEKESWPHLGKSLA